MDLGLADRVYVLTGASAGLGFATAQCLVADGAKVVISSRSPENVTAAVERLNADSAGASGIAADLADPATPGRLIDEAFDRFGRLDGALISVGGPPRGTALEATDEAWRGAFETVFLGVVRTARAVAERLSAGGAIGFVLSISVRSPVQDIGLSNGLRPGLAGVAKEMSDELAPRGIRVMSLLPGRIKTDRNRQLLWGDTDEANRARAQVEATIPLGRMGEPEEFGRVAAFLLSPAASYLTGLAVPVDGGALRGL
jgi:3-oxoacyl-[acyl-carrier protein] reductase